MRFRSTPVPTVEETRESMIMVFGCVRVVRAPPCDWEGTVAERGGGEPCSDQFVKTMANTMTTAVRQAFQSIRDTPSDATKAIPVLPYGPEQSRWFIKRLQDTRSHN